jgi:hypothetical protein
MTIDLRKVIVTLYYHIHGVSAGTESLGQTLCRVFDVHDKLISESVNDTEALALFLTRYCKPGKIKT